MDDYMGYVLGGNNGCVVIFRAAFLCELRCSGDDYDSKFTDTVYAEKVCLSKKVSIQLKIKKMQEVCKVRHFLKTRIIEKRRFIQTHIEKQIYDMDNTISH